MEVKRRRNDRLKGTKKLRVSLFGRPVLGKCDRFDFCNEIRRVPRVNLII